MLGRRNTSQAEALAGDLANRRHKPEELVQKLRQVDVLLGQGAARMAETRSHFAGPSSDNPLVGGLLVELGGLPRPDRRGPPRGHVWDRVVDDGYRRLLRRTPGRPRFSRIAGALVRVRGLFLPICRMHGVRVQNGVAFAAPDDEVDYGGELFQVFTDTGGDNEV